MKKTINIPVDGPGSDLDFCLKFAKIGEFIIKNIFRCELKAEMFRHVDFHNPGVWVANHSNGFWGILDIFITCYFWYGVCQQRKTIAFMSDARLFGIPIIGKNARRLGFKISSIKTVQSCLSAGEWVIIPPGGNTDQLRSIWHRNQTRMYKLQYRNGEFIKKPQTWFIHAAAPLNVKAYPICVAGAHEVTPILWESKSILRYSGLIRLRGEEYWPGFPVSANHLINLYLFYLTGLMSSPIAWALFLFTNIYIDLFYSYPVMLSRIRIRCGEPVALNYSGEGLTLKQKKQENLAILRKLNQEANDCLEEMDKARPLMGKLPSHAPSVDY